MRRKLRALYVARDFIDWRFEHFMAGDDLDSEEWSFRLRGVVGMLVDVGLVEVSDWVVVGATLSERIEKLSSLRTVVKSFMWGRVGDIDKIEYKIAIDIIDKISIVVVEMAVLSIAVQVRVDSLPEFFEGSQRKIRTRLVGLRTDADKRRFLVPLFWFAPEVHLSEAKKDLVAAKKEIIRAQDRMRKTESKVDRADVIKPLPHKAVFSLPKRIERLRKRLAIKRDGLFADVEHDDPGPASESK